MTRPVTEKSPLPVSLVLPVLNGEPFLAASLERADEWLRDRPGGGEVVVVDDGSTDGTAAILAGWAGPGRRVLTLPENRGKGAAVKAGMLAATGERRVFLDAGLTYPFANVDRLLAALDAGADVAIGNRLHPESRYLVAPRAFRRLRSRHRMGRVFNGIVRLFAVPGFRDTQAGIKAATAAAAERIFGAARLAGFSFDVEVLFLARRFGLEVAEVPVTFVYEEEPSTLRLFRDGRRMLRDVAGLRRAARRGLYDGEGRSA